MVGPEGMAQDCGNSSPAPTPVRTSYLGGGGDFHILLEGQVIDDVNRATLHE